MNPHHLLGVDENIDHDELKKRYKTVCKMFHPDKHNQDKSAVFVFQLVKDAYDKIKSSRKKINIPKIPTITDTKEKPVQQTQMPSIVPGTNISENDIRILGEQLKDPWFHPSFNLTDFFGDVSVPEKNKKDMRPQSSRT
jgi:DnaJ-class molecular chaperone